ncbi:hypothetical protein Y032_0020g95 [Ancylostoma ceylanicum]|nr:hypothetical protein Y032_0020g95 [Ancylostoma ceylanicum]
MKWIQLSQVTWSCALEVYLTVGATPVLYIPVPGGYPRGFFRVLGVSTKIQLLIGVLLMHFVAVYTVLLFYFRFEMILPNDHRLKPSPWMRNVAILICHVLYCSSISYSCFASSLEDEQLKQKFRLQYKVLPASFNYSDTMLINCDVIACVQIGWFYGLSMASGFTIVVVLIYQTYKYLHSVSANLSARTIELQKLFLLALISQASVHFIALFLPIFLVLASFWMNPCQDVVNACAYLLCVNGTAGNITMIIVMRTYRQEIIRIVENIYSIYKSFIRRARTLTAAMMRRRCAAADRTEARRDVDGHSWLSGTK